MTDRNWAAMVRKGAAALAIFGMLAGGISLASVFIFSDRSKSPPPTAAPRTPLPPPSPSVPTPREFTINVVVTAQNCAPSGSCVYTYSIEPKYLGLHPFPDKEFTVEYQVTGGYQPQPGTFTVHGGQARIMKDVTVEGPPNAHLAAVVTKIVG